MLTTMFTCMSGTVNATSTVWSGATAASYAGGDGSSANPYQIATAEQLAYLAQQVNSGTSYFGSYFELTQDIFLNTSSEPSANTWPAIGTRYAPFAGTFDGNGHYVCNLYIYSPTTSTVTHKGLFGSNDGTIKNVGVTGTVGAYRYAAGIAGYNSGTIISCFNSAAVTGNDSGSRGSGGIAGANSGTISYCYNTGAVNSLYRPAGGIAGIFDTSGTISNCYSIGEISSAGGTSYAGAIVSTKNNGSILNCYYLNTSASHAVAYPSSTAGTKTANEMKSSDFVSTLGSSYFKDDPGDEYNDGYPVLLWQDHAVPESPGSVSNTVSFTCNNASFIPSLTTTDGSASFTVSPDSGYAAMTVITLPVSSGAYISKTAANSYTISNITTDVQVTVSAYSSAVYEAAAAASGIIDVKSSSAAINGSSYENERLLVDCSNQATALTVNNLIITNGDTNVINFGNYSNTLTLNGENILRGEAGNYAAIHVPSSSSILINGTGRLNMYKNSLGAGIGGNSGEANGTVTISSGSIFAQGSSTGAVIGTGANAASAGNINITGGQLNLATLSNGAVIGGGVGGSIGAVSITGGNLNLVSDWNGVCIGVGNSSDTAGNLYINGASLYVKATNNRTSSTPLITATVTSSASSSVALYPAAIPYAGCSMGIWEEATCLYDGVVNNYSFVKQASESEGRWESNTSDTIYLYLAPTTHLVYTDSAYYTCTYDASLNQFDVVQYA